MPFRHRRRTNPLVSDALIRGHMTRGKTIKCKRTPYRLDSRRVAHSPFRTVSRAKKTLKNYVRGKAVGFTARSSLKSMGLVPRSSACYELGYKYRS